MKLVLSGWPCCGSLKRKHARLKLRWPHLNVWQIIATSPDKCSWKSSKTDESHTTQRGKCSGLISAKRRIINMSGSATNRNYDALKSAKTQVEWKYTHFLKVVKWKFKFTVIRMAMNPIRYNLVCMRHPLSFLILVFQLLAPTLFGFWPFVDLRVHFFTQPEDAPRGQSDKVQLNMLKRVEPE